MTKTATLPKTTKTTASKAPKAPKASKATKAAASAPTPEAGEAKAAAVAKKADKPLTKAAMIGAIASECKLTKVQVEHVLDEVGLLLADDLVTFGKATLPGVCAFKVKAVAARPERVGKNPLTGVEMTFAAKPASKKVQAKPVKAFAEVVIADS